MSADPVLSMNEIEDEPYDSAEDDDFELDAEPDESDLSSADEAEPAKKKRKTDKEAAILMDELDSGDEAMIRKAREKRDRKNKGEKLKASKDEDEDDVDIDIDDEEEGTGDFVRTRAMKKQMYGFSSRFVSILLSELMIIHQTAKMSEDHWPKSTVRL